MPAHGTSDVSIPLPSGGALRAAMAVPGGEGVAAADGRPGMLVLHEAYGLNDDMRRIAARFATNGYVTIVPDLYSEGNTALCLSRMLLDAAFREARHTMAVIEAARAWLADRADVDSGRVGVIGFCMGGGFALLFAARGTVGVAGVNYGPVPKRRERLTGVCPVVASYGALDKQLAPSARRLEEHLTALGVPHDVKMYEGAGHSFWSYDNVPSWATKLPDMGKAGYVESAAEDA